jgi:hypothetical protein
VSKFLLNLLVDILKVLPNYEIYLNSKIKTILIFFFYQPSQPRPLCRPSWPYRPNSAQLPTRPLPPIKTSAAAVLVSRRLTPTTWATMAALFSRRQSSPSLFTPCLLPPPPFKSHLNPP